MKLDLNEIAASLGKRIRYEIDEPPIEDFDGDVRCVAPVRGSVTFTNAGRHIVARGTCRATVELVCSRCLGSYRIDMDMPVDEALPIAGHVPELPEEDEEEELIEEEAEPLYVEGLFDLTELLRQSILVGLPIKTLCSDECKGLCPRCGKNLNDGACECPSDQDAGPFAALAELVQEKELEG